MDKPISMSMKDWLIRRLAVKMMITEKTLEAVINHQFQSANEALASNKSVEISGFGKFLFNHKKAVKRLAEMELMLTRLHAIVDNPQTPETKRNLSLQKISTLVENINSLKPKLNEA